MEKFIERIDEFNKTEFGIFIHEYKIVIILIIICYIIARYLFPKKSDVTMSRSKYVKATAHKNLRSTKMRVKK